MSIKEEVKEFTAPIKSEISGTFGNLRKYAGDAKADFPEDRRGFWPLALIIVFVFCLVGACSSPNKYKPLKTDNVSFNMEDEHGVNSCEMPEKVYNPCELMSCEPKNVCE